MRDLFKNLLGLLIFLTIIYTLYLIYSVTDFLNSEESRIKVSDYEQEIFQKERDLDSLRNEFNKNDIKSSLEDIKLNFDGTPVSWVIKINIKDIAISEETFREQLFNEGFQTLINNEFVIVGPYVDKSRLEIVLEYLNSNTALDNLIIEEW
ncbi:hypothetical protein M9B42_04045 [SAR86 cluster bacterium]|nr:hypothetical protein [bacterium]RCL43322.1 MAG: hypothetical protein DBW93_01960 [SAR86 cluster bacterium]URQ63948.1 hypothetical protein M9B42_04045 [SAR86 cluster bacterium]